MERAYLKGALLVLGVVMLVQGGFALLNFRNDFLAAVAVIAWVMTPILVAFGARSIAAEIKKVTEQHER